MSARYQGTVKTWIGMLGFGYITAQDNFAEDLYVARVPKREGVTGLKPGEQVEFSISQVRGRTIATDLTFPNQTSNA